MNTPDSGLILILSFVLLAARTPVSFLALAAAQAVVLAVSAAVQGYYPEAAALLVLNAVGLPLGLRAHATSQPRAPRIGFPARLGAGVVLALLAAPLSVPLAVLLLGLLTVAGSRDRVVHVAGLLAMQNGIALAGLALPDAERMAAILPVIPALACAALWSVRRGPV